MKIVFIASILIVAFAATSANLQCEHRKLDINTDWVDMVEPCIQKMRNQIQEELKAAMQYLALGAYFSQDTVNRPGFAKLFFESASEEREHSIKLIHYLLMRGELTESVSNLINKTLDVPKTQWVNAVEALKDALALEASVTKKIRDVIITCEEPKDPTNFNDYHLVDYLTGVFLEEQYKGQRDLAGKISTLEKLMDKHGTLGEFLYDKKLLKDEL